MPTDKQVDALDEAKKLALNECAKMYYSEPAPIKEDVVGEDEIEKLALEGVPFKPWGTFVMSPETNDFEFVHLDANINRRKDWIAGYKAAQSSRGYSLEDLKNAFDAGELVGFDNGINGCSVHPNKKEYINSLSK